MLVEARRARHCQDIMSKRANGNRQKRAAAPAAASGTAASGTEPSTAKRPRTESHERLIPAQEPLEYHLHLQALLCGPTFGPGGLFPHDELKVGESTAVRRCAKRVRNANK